MSLYIGNLPQRIHKDELEHVFRRFGWCTVQVKDGYGFAVYGIRAQAETALRQLRGKRICGAVLSLSWSNKQPRLLQPFARDARSYKKHHGRGFTRGDDHLGVNQRSNAHNVSRFRQRQLDDRGGRLDSAELHVERGRLSHDYERQDHFPIEELQDGGDSIDPNILDTGRWDDEVDSLSTDSRLAFDRYQPDHDYESGEGDERNQMTDLGSSARREIPGEEARREQTGERALYHYDSRRDKKSCYVCGNLGHKMRDCPQQHASRSKTYKDSRNRGRYGLKFTNYTSRGRLLSRNGMLMGRHRSDSNGSGSGNPGNIKRHKQARDRFGDHGAEFRQKRKIEDENGTLNGCHGRRVKKSVSSPSQSNYASKRSNSPMSISTPHSHSRSQSMSSSSNSSSSELMSDQLKSGTESVESKPRSSSHTSLSLSVSLGLPLLSPPPKKAETNLSGLIDISTSPRSKLTMQENHTQEIGSDEKNTESGKILGGESLVDFVKIEDDVKMDNLQKNDENNQPEPLIPSDANNQCSAFLEPLREENEPLQTHGVTGIKIMSEPKEKSDSEGPTHHHSDKYSISPDELYHVMKHYNLEFTGEKVGDISVEDYFGSARLWPWEIIFYRRLKKGAVLSENYARRLAQNQEFGITDKYVRSSSGWGEPTQG